MVIGYGHIYLDLVCVPVSFLSNIGRYPMCDTAWFSPCIHYDNLLIDGWPSEEHSCESCKRGGGVADRRWFEHKERDV